MGVCNSTEKSPKSSTNQPIKSPKKNEPEIEEAQPQAKQDAELLVNNIKVDLSEKEPGAEPKSAEEAQAESKNTVVETPDTDPYTVILYYKYVLIQEPKDLEAFHVEICTRLALTGRVLVASEGINGSVAGSSTNIAEYQAALEQWSQGEDEAPFKGIQWKDSFSAIQPFPDLKVAVVKELISTGGKVARPNPGDGGVHLDPEDFHTQLKDPNVVVLDVRNNNEYMIGHFENAVNPKTRFFSEWCQYADGHIEEFSKKKVLMYCTGGIRCEKASAYLKQKGVQEVFQLNGGIHKYMERFPDGGEFMGKNYVFDRRVAMESNNSEIIGRCCECGCPFDRLFGDRVCCVCRDALLVCDKCKAEKNGNYYCETHSNLRGMYYYFLDGFSIQELEAQRAQLKELHFKLSGPKKHKNRRRTLNRQVAKIDQRIAELRVLEEEQPGLPVEAVGALHADVPAPAPCRSCGDVGCEGACWGFFKVVKEPIFRPIEVDAPAL